MRRGKNVICVLLSMIIIMNGLCGCGVDKDGFRSKGLWLRAIDCSTNLISAGSKIDLENGRLTPIHSFEEDGLTLYYYELDKVAMGQQIHIQEVVLNWGDNYDVYMIPITPEWAYSDENSYKCYDFDKDGKKEVAAEMVLGSRDGVLHKKLFIFDYNEKKGSYDLCFLGIPDMTEVLDASVIKFFKKRYKLNYKLYQESRSGEYYDSSILHDLMAEEGNNVEYGDYMDVSFNDSKKIDISVAVNEQLPGQTVYTRTGYIECVAKYKGDGEFEVDAKRYKEDTTKKE